MSIHDQAFVLNLPARSEDRSRRGFEFMHDLVMFGRVQAIRPGQRRMVDQCRLAHVVTSNRRELWNGEAMSVCGRLIEESDPIAEDDAPTCGYCERGERVDQGV